MPTQYKRLRRQGAAGRERPLGKTSAHRGRGALPLQADGLQGRIRSRAPAHRPQLPRHASTACSRGDFKLNYLILACDPLVGGQRRDAWRACAKAARTWRSTATARRRPLSCATPTGRTRRTPAPPRSRAPSAPMRVGAFDADAAATTLMGDSIYANPMMLGYAWQKGWVPLEHASLMRAIELNAVAIDEQQGRLRMGPPAPRTTWPRVQKLRAAGRRSSSSRSARRVESLVARRVEFLTGYQNAAYADAVQGLRRARCSRPRRPLRQDQPDRSRGALPVQADGLQGRVRSRAPAHRPRLPRPGRRHVRGRLQAQLPPGAADHREEERQGRAAEAEVRPVRC